VPNWKVKYLFKSDTSGWTEEWYAQSNDPDPRFIAPAVNTVLRARFLGLGVGVITQGTRVTDVDNPGLSWPQPLPPEFGRQYQPALLPADNPTTCVDARFNAGLLKYHRVMNLRGVPDEWVFRDPITLVMRWRPAAEGAFAAYVAALQAARFLLRVISKDEVDVNARPVQGVTWAAGFTTVTSAAHGYAVGNEIRISKVKGGNAALVAKGVYQISSRTLDTFSYPAPDPTVPIVYDKGGIIRRRVPAYARIDEGFIQSVSKRDTGRAFFLPRGRRRA
jgi:hypothetical protein